MPGAPPYFDEEVNDRAKDIYIEMVGAGSSVTRSSSRASRRSIPAVPPPLLERAVICLVVPERLVRDHSVPIAQGSGVHFQPMYPPFGDD